MYGDMSGGHEERLFYEGYGVIDYNQTAMAYYRYERVIQDLAAFCDQLLNCEAGGPNREQAYIWFVSSFQPGHDVEMALTTDRAFSI